MEKTELTKHLNRVLAGRYPTICQMQPYAMRAEFFRRILIVKKPRRIDWSNAKSVLGMPQ